MSGSPSGMGIPIMGSGGAAESPYMTKIGGSGGGIQIPQIQFQAPKMNNQQQQPSQMPTVGQGVANAANSLTAGIKTAYNLYQQRFGQQNQQNNPPMNSQPGGVWAGNPTMQQVGPVNPTADQQATADAQAIPSSSGTSASSSPGTGGPSAGAVGGGIASGLSAVSSAFGKESQQDAQLAANPPKPTITGQPFTNFQFNPFIEGGDLV